MAALPLLAQQPCPTNEALPPIPLIAAQGNVLRGTIVVAAEQQMIPTRNPTTKETPASTNNCYPQWVRVLRGLDTTPAYPAAAKGTIPMPTPGPTLRARVGDLVQLTLLNQIDPNVFPYSIDQGDKSFGCDQTSLYPANTSDQFPNCFHGSSTVNIHFHGSHTNPNTTGDNVFLELRPSPRTQNEANTPTVSSQTFKTAFDEFFKQCASMLKPAEPLSEWPTKWTDLPAAYREKQEELLKAYDASGKYKKKLWPVDARQIAQGAWPQYYVGAYPYCWRIPHYTQPTWPPVAPLKQPTPSANTVNNAPQHTHGPDAANTAGAGTAELPGPEPTRLLQMGQSPGTHWYHAHKHGSTAINVSNGMTGAFIMEGQYDDDLNAFYGKDWTRSQPVMIINQLGVTPNLERGGGGTNSAGQPLGQDQGPSFSVNGRIQPVVKMAPGEVQMWRIVNTSSRAGAVLQLPAGFQWRQIAQDGVQLNDANYQSPNFRNQSVLLMPGNRADLLVLAPPQPQKTPVPLLVQNVVDPTVDLLPPNPATAVTLLSVNVTGTPKSMQFIPRAPAFPPFLADIKEAEVTGTKVIRFATRKGNPGFSNHFIDDKQFSGEVGEVVLLNTVEEWKVVNETFGPPIAHPFHIHINPFQVTEVFDPNETLTSGTTTVPRYVTRREDLKVDGQCFLDLNDRSTWKPCVKQPTENALWWDVFAIPSGKQIKDNQGNVIAQIPGHFKMRSRFVDYAGYYVIHCHILAHEDRGMMTIVEVAPLRSPYSHH